MTRTNQVQGIYLPSPQININSDNALLPIPIIESKGHQATSPNKTTTEPTKSVLATSILSYTEQLPLGIQLPSRQSTNLDLPSFL